MTKKEVIKYLHEEFGLVDIEEDENSEGELYITSQHLKDLNKLIPKIKKTIKRYESKKQELAKKINEGKEFICINEDRTYIKDSKFEKDVVILGDNAMITNSIWIKGNVIA